jgi:hypothetical protein
VVAHGCNPKYLGSRDLEDHSLRPARAKHYKDPDLNKTNWHGGMSVIPNMQVAIGMNIKSKSSPGKKPSHYLKNELKLKGLGHGSNAEVFAQGPEFKPQYSQINK